MKLNYKNISALFAATALAVSLQAAALSDQDKQFLTAYGKAHDALVADDLASANYYVAHCPMKNKDWVQTSTTIANPYGGKEMISCGEIKK